MVAVAGAPHLLAAATAAVGVAAAMAVAMQVLMAAKVAT
jgi:hypothetical protein